eukprot:scaffold3733_cov153-Chaetoceros_neogracile.AAC.2
MDEVLDVWTDDDDDVIRLSVEKPLLETSRKGEKEKRQIAIATSNAQRYFKLASTFLSFLFIHTRAGSPQQHHNISVIS